MESASSRLDSLAAKVDNVCPAGTKMWLLCLGYQEADDAWLIQAGNTWKTSSAANPPERKRRTLPMYSVLIEHPKAGLLLWETGPGKDFPTIWGPERMDVFPRVLWDPCQELEAAIEATGHTLKDVKAVLLGHLHLDHAGGLDSFKGTDVPIYTHEKELKNAFFSVATGCDAGVYLDNYLDLKLKWRTFTDSVFDFAEGITLHHWPGHTDGLCGMQINYIFTSDMFHIRENYETCTPQGFLIRVWNAWHSSYNKVKRLSERTGGKVVMGHDLSICQDIWDLEKLRGGPLM